MTDFPDRIFVTLRKAFDGSETLECAFRPEDLTGEVGVYELTSTGRVAFVEDDAKESTQLEQSADSYLALEAAK